MSFFDIRNSRYLYSNHMLDRIPVILEVVDICHIYFLLISEHPDSELAKSLDKRLSSYFDYLRSKEAIDPHTRL